MCHTVGTTRLAVTVWTPPSPPFGGGGIACPHGSSRMEGGADRSPTQRDACQAARPSPTRGPVRPAAPRRGPGRRSPTNRPPAGLAPLQRPRPSDGRPLQDPTPRQSSERAEPDGAAGSGAAAAGLMALSSGGARAGPALPDGLVDRVRRCPARDLRQGGRGAARGCPAGIRAPSRTGRRCGPPNPAFPADGCPASPAARTGRRRSPFARLERRTPGSSSVAVVFVGFPGARA
jgi:hypothetical protein